MKRPADLGALLAGAVPDAEVVPLEQAVLGAALVSREVLPPLLPAEFLLDGHRAVWSRLVAMREAGQVTDLLTVSAALRTAGELDHVGGPAALALMAESAALHVHTLDYAKGIREAATRRRLTAFGAELIGSGMTPAQAQVEMSKLPGPLLFDYDPAEVWEGIVNGWKQERMRFGFGPLDDTIGGLYQGDFIVIGGRTSHGKALAVDTKIPTVGGWTTMGHIRVGDQLFGADGQPTRVKAVSAVMVGRPCYRLTFSDGTHIVADAGHEWFTWSRAARRSGLLTRPTPSRTSPLSRDQRHRAARPVLVTTEQIRATLLHCHYRNHAIPTCQPLNLPDIPLLPVDPYLLGVWLGDGKTTDGTVYAQNQDIPLVLATRGTILRRRAQRGAYGVPGLKVQLRRLGVLGHKHIPLLYLRASESQRRALLAGLLDTDGTVSSRHGQISFDVTDHPLALGALELARTLGYRATMSSRVVAGRPDRTTCFRVQFQTDDKVFWLSRKADLHQQIRSNRVMHHRCDRRTIVNVEPIPTVPVRCIQVDAPDGLFLAGEAFVSTHNSAFAVALSLWLAQQGTSTDYLTLEDPVSAIVRRQVSNLTGLVTRRLREGSLSSGEFDVAEEAVAEIQRLPLRVVGVDQLGGMEERHLAAYLAVTAARVIIVDHFQQVVTPGGEESRNYGLERVLRTLHGEALRTGRVILLLAQLNREAEARKGPPRLSDLRDCGALEQAARQVWLLYWPHRHKPEVDWHDFEVYIAKYSEGGNAKLPLWFDASTGRFARRGEEHP